MTNKKYQPQDFEENLRNKWAEDEVYKVENDFSKPKYYILDMFPYPSGSGLHVGHPKGYIATDVIARMKHMQGFNVLHPMGWDAFGLPAENYAIKNQIHPRAAVEENIAKFKSQLQKLGLTYDWDREINTTDPEYIRWTQWIFIKLLEKGLAYESHEPINWCPSCQTGLANEDLEDGKCERCGSEIEMKPMRQWVLKITEYADRLLDDLDKLPGWEKSIKEMQREWIGRKNGAIVVFEIKGSKSLIKAFTTRPDTLFGCSYVVVSPESEFINENKAAIENLDEVEGYIENAANKSEIERTANNKEKTGVRIDGLKAINPANGDELPIFVADYVLNNFGTGYVMGVPAHDERDYAFAKKYNLEITQVVEPEAEQEVELPFVDYGVNTNSDFLNGKNTKDAIDVMIEWLEDNSKGKKETTYRLQDWVFSRQRYWGEPIPVVHCKECGVVPVDEKDLPLRLPDVENYQPSGTGESPLATIDEWVNTTCPKCDDPAKRETNTMPQWAGSSWYWLRYMDPENSESLVGKDAEEYWGPVDQYVGGAEHATRHLIYARFWNKFLFDIGVVNHDEPFKKLQHVGLIQAEDGSKMSKRLGNVINPDDVVEEFGADSLRIYEMFMGPFANATMWNTKGIVGVRRFLDRVWNIALLIEENLDNVSELESILHKTIKEVGSDIENFKFNTAISKMMILSNEIESVGKISKTQYAQFLSILHPFAPHITEELWVGIGNNDSIYNHSWPEFDEEKIKQEVQEIGISVNGKPRAQLEISEEMSEEDIKDAAKTNEKVQSFVEGKEITRVIYVKDRLVNIVVK